MEINKLGRYKVVHLLDGSLIDESVQLVNEGKADGINFNFSRNFPKSIDAIRNAPLTRYIQINDYVGDFDYSAINSLQNLESLSIYTTDSKEINFQNFPLLMSAAINWRPRASSLFDAVSLEELFLGKYQSVDLVKLEKLKNLKYLRINTGSVQMLKGIEQLINLEKLYLMQTTKLRDITGIESLKNLKYLRIDNCKAIENIDTVSKLKHLSTIELIGTTPKLSS
jgi:Leucine-rich repeat (LRR) protein